MTLTSTASRVIIDRLKHRGSGLGIRVGVKAAGCSGYEYTMEYVDSLNSDDIIFKDRGVNIIVDAKSLQMRDLNFIILKLRRRVAVESP